MSWSFQFEDLYTQICSSYFWLIKYTKDLYQLPLNTNTHTLSLSHTHIQSSIPFTLKDGFGFFVFLQLLRHLPCRMLPWYLFLFHDTQQKFVEYSSVDIHLIQRKWEHKNIQKCDLQRILVSLSLLYFSHSLHRPVWIHAVPLFALPEKYCKNTKGTDYTHI